MTDREWLELAAKAAGYDLVTHTGYDEDDGVYVTHTWIREDVLLVRWNPLLSDGDALRLAVKLQTPLLISNSMVRCIWGTSLTQSCQEDAYTDHYAATRRAIVRAAAEIGKAIN